MIERYEPRISGKTQELDFKVSCSSKTCKTKCARKQFKKEINGNLETICSNYGNGKNGNKPKQKDNKINNDIDKDLFVLGDLK